MEQPAPGFRLEEVIVITDDQVLAQRAAEQLSEMRVRITIVSPEHFQPPSCKNFLLVIDARDLPRATRELLRGIGSPQQRIAVGDPRFDNRLAKSFLPVDGDFQGTVERIAIALATGPTWSNPKQLRF